MRKDHVVGGLKRVAVDTPNGSTVSVAQTGQGPDLLVLHRSIGGDSLATFVAALGSKFAVVAPAMPGYDDSSRPDWARSVRDIAAIVRHVVRPFSAERPVLVGPGLGGWVAAEMAAMSPECFRALVLIGPLGVQPRQGEITDPFLFSCDRYIEMGFADKDAYRRTFGEDGLGSDAWLRRERNREMTTRIAWKPRMFDQTLPFRLQYIELPTLILWGEQDEVVPRGVVERYGEAIQGARLEVLPGRGHMLEVEDPDRITNLISSFVANQE
jgi:pimeloyl-ACP methyl ester carboxylesterase